MILQRTVKLFKNGGCQAVRLPKEFRFPGREVVLKKEGSLVYIVPARHSSKSWLELLHEIGPVRLAARDQPGWTDRRRDRELCGPRRRRRR